MAKKRKVKVVKTIRFREYEDDTSSTSSASTSPESSSQSLLVGNFTSLDLDQQSRPHQRHNRPGNRKRQYRECILPLPAPSGSTSASLSSSSSPTKSNLLHSKNTKNKNHADTNDQEEVVLYWKTVGSDDPAIDVNKKFQWKKIHWNETNLHVLMTMKNTWKQKLQSFFRDLLLPVGYPHSVNEGYIHYQFYDSLQGLCSYLRGVVSTTAVLTAAGVGDSEATALSAAMHWATKDGCGMIGGLVFSYYSSSYFDSHVKEFRFFADIMIDVGLTLDMIAPYVSKRYLILISIVSTLCRTLCGITAGATKGSISQHFAKHNLADLNAKEGTQETLVSLIGMIFGIFIARMIQSMEEQCKILEDSSIYSYSALAATWYIYIALTATHLWANYVGVNAVRLRTLNRSRAEFVLREVVQKGVQLVEEDVHKVKSDTIAMKMKLMEYSAEAVITSPSECNESLWDSFKQILVLGNVELGAKLSDCFSHITRDEVISIVGQIFRNEKYMIIINKTDTVSPKINVVLRVGASEEDQFKAFIHAMVLHYCSMNKRHLRTKKSQMQLIARSKNCIDLMFNTNTMTLSLLTEKGWDDKLLLGFGQRRAAWDNVKTERQNSKKL